MQLNSAQLGLRRCFVNPEALYGALADHIADAAATAIVERGRFDLVITGGSSILPLFSQLRAIKTRWDDWHVYWSDERSVPSNHPERNSRAAIELWLAHVPIPVAQVHSIPAEMGIEIASQCYSEVLANVGTFDLVLLSLGEDGHVAGIFPGTEAEDPLTPTVLAVINAPKPPSRRVSLSLHRLANTSQIVLLALGNGKSAALQGLVRQGTEPASVLARMTKVEIWVDLAANDACA